MRKWRKREEKGERYRGLTRDYKKLCERKKEEGERLMREAEEAKTENKVWELINRE